MSGSKLICCEYATQFSGGTNQCIQHNRLSIIYFSKTDNINRTLKFALPFDCAEKSATELPRTVTVALHQQPLQRDMISQMDNGAVPQFSHIW